MLNSVAVIILSAIIAIFPIWILVFYCCKFKKWGKKDFKKKYGAAIAGLRTDRRSSLFYPLIFIARRFAFVFVAKVTSQIIFVQIMTMLSFSFLQFTYLVYCRPFKE